MKRKQSRRTLLALATIGLVLGCTTLLGSNSKKVDAEVNPNVGYRTRAWVYSDTVKQRIASACFTLKDEMGNTIVNNTTTEMNRVYAYNYQKGTLLCDVVTLTKPSYASYTATKADVIDSAVCYFVVEVLFNGERIYREDYSHSFLEKTWKEKDTASNLNDKCMPYSTANYEFDNSYCSNADALPNAMTINSKNEALPSFVGNTFSVYEEGSVVDKTYELPTISSADATFAGYFEKDQINEMYEMFYDDNCEPVRTTNLLKDTTLTALFESDIVLNTNGGQFDTPKTSVERKLINEGSYFVGEQMRLPNPTRSGYSFEGWTGTGYDIPTIDLTIPANAVGEISYTANWKAVGNIVTFVTGEGGSVVEPQSVLDGDLVIKPETPSKTLEGIRYEFVRWVIEVEGIKEEFDFSTPVYENITLEAEWISYVDQFVANYMHPEILPSDSGSGKCVSEGWYVDAKAAFNELNSDEKTLFLNNNDYKAYANRLVAWAAAYGDGLVGQSLVNFASLPYSVSENNNLVIISVIVGSIACTFIALLIIVKRKQKINK